MINRPKEDWVRELTFYRWKKQFGGLMPTKFGRVRQLAGLSLDQDVLYEIIRKALAPAKLFRPEESYGLLVTVTDSWRAAAPS